MEFCSKKRKFAPDNFIGQQRKIILMRSLTQEEITLLSTNGCKADDWSSIRVVDPFDAARVENVKFYGTIVLGSNVGTIEVVEGFEKPCGVRNTTLRNVVVGNDSLIEDTTSVANTIEEGDDLVIPVLNEAGDGNVMLYPGMSSQVVAMQMRYANDVQWVNAFRKLVKQSDNYCANCSFIGHHTCVVGAGKIINSHVGNYCYVGENVILEGCYVSESTTITNGFTAEHSIFLANTYMANGEACAAYCGPFSASHHKSSLLIGVDVSFYNAGSATNFSNHAYKMGPLHYGTLQRGTKTASGSHILLPAQVGPYSMCMGKIQSHPDTRQMPFSYLIASGEDTFLIPARGLLTVGLFRDVEKWPKRDKRPADDRPSHISHQWLSPYTIQAVQQGKADLETLLQGHPDSDTYRYHGCRIRRHSLLTGIKIYDLALRLVGNPEQKEEWSDLGGMLLPKREELQLVDDIKSGKLSGLNAVVARLDGLFEQYNQPTPFVPEVVKDWHDFIRMDAQKEYDLGDVDKEVLDAFLAKL